MNENQRFELYKTTIQLVRFYEIRLWGISAAVLATAAIVSFVVLSKNGVWFHPVSLIVLIIAVFGTIALYVSLKKNRKLQVKAQNQVNQLAENLNFQNQDAPFLAEDRADVSIAFWASCAFVVLLFFYGVLFIYILTELNQTRLFHL